MALLVTFNRQRAEQVAESILGGNAIDPPAGGWTGEDLLMLAGILCGMRAIQGPAIPPGSSDVHSLATEHREALLANLAVELTVAVEFGACHTIELFKDEDAYSRRYDDNASAVVRRTDTGSQITPVAGLKAG